MSPIRVAVLTVSDLSAAGKRDDTSGDAIVEWVSTRGYRLAAREVVPDETDLIAGCLIRWADEATADVIFTTGGTGFGPRDVTPEATKTVIERDAPGISEAMRADARQGMPRTILSRAVAGIRHATLIVNLPGSPGGVRDGLRTLETVVEHAVQILTHQPTDH